MKTALREKLQAIANEIVETLAQKDDAYKSSWKAKGGYSAFFNLDRKFSRVEAMAEEYQYDLFEAITVYPTDGPDALKDLIGYALLTLSETYSPPKLDRLSAVAPALDDSGEPGPDYVDQDKEN